MGINIRDLSGRRGPNMGRFAGPGGGSDWGGGSYDVTLGDPISAMMAGPIGYNPAIVAAGGPNVSTGNEFIGGVPAYPPQPSFDAPIISPNFTDWVGNPTSGWESFAPTGGVNPFNANPYNIDNIVQPSPAYPTMNAPYNIASPWVNPNISPFGGFGGTWGLGRGDR